MTAISAAAKWSERNGQGPGGAGFVDRRILVTGTVAYAGMPLEFVEATGLVQPATDGTANNFAGIVENDHPTVTGDSATVYVSFKWGYEALMTGAATLAVTQENDTDFFASADTDYVTATTTVGPKIGVMRKFISTTSAWFEIQRTGTKGS